MMHGDLFQTVEQIAIIVYFNNDISSELATRWNLATMAESVMHGRSMAHVVVMPHVNKFLLDDFLTDLEKDLKPA